MGHLRATEWVVHTLGHAEALEFLRTQHYARGGANTSVVRHGLYRRDMEPLRGELLGVALWMPPTRAAGEAVAGSEWGGVLHLSRLCVAPEVPTNGASFLLGRSMRAIDRRRWPVLLTYADTGEGHTGAIYLATNWTCEGPVPAGDTWVDGHGLQRGRKRGGRNLSADEMRALGFVRKPPAVKLRFTHRVRSRRASGSSPGADRRGGPASGRPGDRREDAR